MSIENTGIGQNNEPLAPEATTKEPEDNYVAYCRFTEKSIVTCNSDSPKAFKVYRHPPSSRDVDLARIIKKWRSMNGLDFGSATYFKCADELEGLLNG